MKAASNTTRRATCSSALKQISANRTGEGTPLSALVHVSNNNALSVLWPDMFPHLAPRWILTASVVAYGALAALVLLATRGRLGFPPRPVEFYEKSGHRCESHRWPPG